MGVQFGLYVIRLDIHGARCSVVGWGNMLQAGRSRVRFPMRLLDFQLIYSFQPHYGPGVDPASKRNEYQDSPWGQSGRPVRNADNLTALCVPIA
jgi:hypothetical protein